MKAVLISIRPEWCEKIASGKKTVEVRKNRPKLESPFKVYIYCTNAKPFIVWGDVFRGNWETEITAVSGYSREEAEKIWDLFNGKVMGEFVCDKIFDICIEVSKPDDLPGYPFPCTGLTDKEIMQYLGNGKTGYGWHISDLVIYDTPKELSSFTKLYGTIIRAFDSPYIQRPPQSWCYVEVPDGG